MKRFFSAALTYDTEHATWDAPQSWKNLEDDTLRHHKARDRHREDMRRWMTRTGIM